MEDLIPYTVKKWCNSVTLGYIQKWLNTVHSTPKKITFIGMTHTGENLKPDILKEALESQRLVLKRLNEIKPRAVGIEGFAGNIFTLENYIDQQARIGQVIGKGISRKNFLTKWLNRLDQYSAMYYVHKNPTVKGFGIESIDLLKSSNSMLESRMFREIKEQSESRTWYFVARQSEIFFKTDQTHIISPVGSTHNTHLPNIIPIVNAINIEIAIENC